MNQESKHKEPPFTHVKSLTLILICIVNDYKAFYENIKTIPKGEAFLCKSSTNSIKLTTSSPDSYRSVI